MNPDLPILVFDASNISSGGGLTHLINLLQFSNPLIHPFSHIHVWVRRTLHSRIPDHDWITVHPSPSSFLPRLIWHTFSLPSFCRQINAQLVFYPGTFNLSCFQPSTTLSQNLLPYDLSQIVRYRFSLQTLRLVLLRLIHTISFRRSTSIYFLSSYAKARISPFLPYRFTDSPVIPHGINPVFRSRPRPQRPIEECTIDDPFKLVYVSIIDCYKNHLSVLRALSLLQQTYGWSIKLALIGPSYAPALNKLLNHTNYEAVADIVNYYGELTTQDLASFLVSSDLGIFASSCENLPITLLEKMSAGLPTVTSNAPPMSDLCSDLPVLFNPYDATSIADTLYRLIINPKLRVLVAEEQYRRSFKYTWESATELTFQHFYTTIKKYSHQDN